MAGMRGSPKCVVGGVAFSPLPLRRMFIGPNLCVEVKRKKHGSSYRTDKNIRRVSVIHHDRDERSSSNVLVCAVRRAVFSVSRERASLEVFVFFNVLAVCCDCCSVALSPIKDGVQQSGEGCDGRLVQASPSDASRLECCSMFSQCMFLFWWRERSDASDTCVVSPCRTGQRW